MDSKYLSIKDVRATGSYSDTELTKLWVYKSSAGYLVIEGKDELLELNPEQEAQLLNWLTSKQEK